jgi:hypothetical protein
MMKSKMLFFYTFFYIDGDNKYKGKKIKNKLKKFLHILFIIINIYIYKVYYKRKTDNLFIN